MERLDVRLDRREMLLTSAIAIAAAASWPAMAAPGARPGAGRRQSFDLGWRFFRGEAPGAEAIGFDDSAWRPVDLPHDWSIEALPPAEGVVGPFTRNAEGGTATGFTVGGEGWYRKRFRLHAPPGGRVELAFDGVYMASEVWVNGVRLGFHANGYTPFSYDLTPHLAADGENLVAVRARNLGKNSRWYPGSGIYRHVWLDVLPQAARFERWGLSVATRRVDEARAELDLETRVADPEAGLTIAWRITGEDGATVWQATDAAAPAVRRQAVVQNPRLWSPDTPALYTLEAELRRGAQVLDRLSTPFGMRIVAFDSERGITLNGTPIKLRGGCIHHDNGLLGAAAFDAAEERKVRLLKARGFNAVRPSHNPFSEAFLDACDRHGLMVIGETFDAWRMPKLPQDYSTHFDEAWREDLRAIVLSARNHPSVIMWSIGNEIPGRNLPDGLETQWRLANETHRLDPTRAVTAAINDFPGRPVIPSAATARAGQAGVADDASSVFLDVVGFNYKLRKYEREHARFPGRVLYGSESFPKDIFATWALTERSPWLIGDFVWTAMDYLGEAGIGGSAYGSGPAVSLGSWPWVVSGCGDLDLIGCQKGPSLARDVVWGLSPLEVAVQKPPPPGKVESIRPWGWSDERASWTWPGAEGRALAVRIYTAGDEVELRLNGRVLERRPVSVADQKHLEIKVAYAPGELEVIAFRGGGEIARRKLVTAGPPAAVRLAPEVPKAGAGRGDIAFVGLEVVDSQGRRVPDIEAAVKLKISGPAELAAFGSANPLACGSFQSPQAKTWDGRGLIVLRGAGRRGRVRIEAQSEGLRQGAAVLSFA